MNLAAGLAVAFALSTAGPLLAQDPSDEAVVQKLAHGQVDWSAKKVIATGSGAASLKAKSVAVARLKAERAAKLDALRNILETIEGIQVNGKRSAGDLMSNGEIKSKIAGMARGFKVVDTRYYSDGSVDVVVEMPIDDQLTSTLFSGVKSTSKPRQVSTAGTAPASGLIVNAKSLGVVPSMAPRILDENKKEVYGASIVSKAGIAQGGIAGYTKDVSSAEKTDRVGKSPMKIKALRLARGTKTDIIISNADADKLRNPNSNLSFLAEGKVVIVVD